MRYRVHSPLFPPDRPSRIYAGRVFQDGPASFRAVVEVTHLDPQGRRVKNVIADTVGCFLTRAIARRNVLRALNSILSQYPEESIVSLSKTSKVPKEDCS